MRCKEIEPLRSESDQLLPAGVDSSDRPLGLRQSLGHSIAFPYLRRIGAVSQAEFEKDEQPGLPQTSPPNGRLIKTSNLFN